MSSSSSSGAEITIKIRNNTSSNIESYLISDIEIFADLKVKILLYHQKLPNNINYKDSIIRIYKETNPDIELLDSDLILDYIDQDLFYNVVYLLNFRISSDLFGSDCFFTQFIPHEYTFGQLYDDLEKLFFIPKDIIHIEAVKKDILCDKETFYYNSSKEKVFNIYNFDKKNFMELSSNGQSQLFIIKLNDESFPLFLPKNSCKNDLIQHLKNISKLPFVGTKGTKYEFKINGNEFEILPEDDGNIFCIEILSLKEYLNINLLITDKNLRIEKHVDPDDFVGSLLKCSEIGDNYQIYIKSELIPNDTTFQSISSKYPDSLFEFYPFLLLKVEIVDIATLSVRITSKMCENSIKMEIINQIKDNQNILSLLSDGVNDKDYLRGIHPNNLFFIESRGLICPYFNYNDIRRGAFIIGTELKCPNTEIYFELIDIRRPLIEIEKLLRSLDNRELYCGEKLFTKNDVFSDTVLHYLDKNNGSTVKLHFIFIYMSEANKSMMFSEITLISYIKEKIRNETQYENVYLYINQRLLQDYEQIRYIPPNSIIYVDYHEPKLRKLYFAQINYGTSIHIFEGFFKNDAKISDVYDYLESYNIGKIIKGYAKNQNCISFLPNYLIVKNDESLIFDDFAYDKTIFDTRFLHDPNPIIEYQYENNNYEIKISEDETVGALLNMISERHGGSNQKFYAQFQYNGMYIRPDTKINEIKFQINIIKIYELRCKFVLPTGISFRESFSIIEPISEVMKKLSEKLGVDAQLILSLNNTTTLSSEYLLVQYHINHDDKIFIKMPNDYGNYQSDVLHYKFFNYDGKQCFDDIEYCEKVDLKATIKGRKSNILDQLIKQYNRHDLLLRHVKFYLFNYPIRNENTMFEQLQLNCVYEIHVSEQFCFYLPNGDVIIKHFFPETSIKKVKSMISRKTRISKENIRLFVKGNELDDQKLIAYALKEKIEITLNAGTTIVPSLLHSLCSNSISSTNSSYSYTLSYSSCSMAPVWNVDERTNYIEITYPDGIAKVKFFDEFPISEDFINNYAKPFIDADNNIKECKIQLKAESNGNEISLLPSEILYNKIRIHVDNPIETSFKMNYNGIAYNHEFNQFCTIESLKNWVSKQINIEPNQIDVIFTTPIRCFCDDEVLLSKYSNNRFKIIKCVPYLFKLPDKIETIQIYCSQFTSVKMARYRMAKYLLSKSPIKQCQLSDTVFQDLYNGLTIDGYENDEDLLNNSKYLSIKHKERPSDQTIKYVNVHSGEVLVKFDSNNKIPIGSTINSIGKNFPKFSACTYKDTSLPFGASFYSFCIFCGDIYVSSEQSFDFNLPTKKIITKIFKKAIKVEEVKTILINEFNLADFTAQNISFMYNGNHLLNDEYIQAKIPFDSCAIDVVRLYHYVYEHKKEGKFIFDGYYHTLEEAKKYIMTLLFTKNDVLFYYNDERIEKFDNICEDEIIYFRIGEEYLFDFNGQQIRGFYPGFKRTRKELANEFGIKDEKELVFKIGNKKIKKLVTGVSIKIEIHKPLYFKIDGTDKKIIKYFKFNSSFSKVVKKLIKDKFVVPEDINNVKRTSSTPTKGANNMKTKAIFKCGGLIINENDKVQDIFNLGSDVIISYSAKRYQIKIKNYLFTIELSYIATIRDLWLKVFNILLLDIKINVNAPESIILSVNSKMIDLESYTKLIVSYGIKESDVIIASIILFQKNKGINLNKLVQKVERKEEEYKEGKEALKMEKFDNSGSNGNIIKCCFRDNKKEYALKIIYSRSDQKHIDRKNFEREVSLLLQLNHKFILKITRFNWRKGKLMILTPYMPNGSLERFYHFSNTTNPYINSELMNNPTERLIIVYGIAHGMKKLHSRNIIHRDLKPKNIFLDKNMIPRIGDFGLAKSLSIDINNSQKGSNYPYRDPFCEKELYLEFDVYAFGFILYELYTGVPQSRQPKIKEKKNRIIEQPRFDDSVPFGRNKDLENLIKMCWEQNPSQRPSFKNITECLLDEKYQFVGSDKNALSALLTRIKEKQKSKK